MLEKMENNPDMESFEHFIKQQSDDFRMYPTKRVWYSLYNNLHPSSKWPSISMCIVLLTTLFLIGFLNTNNNHSSIAIAQNKSNTGKTVTISAVLTDDNILIQNTISPTSSAVNELQTPKKAISITNQKLTVFKSKQVKPSLTGVFLQQNKTANPVGISNDASTLATQTTKATQQVNGSETDVPATNKYLAANDWVVKIIDETVAGLAEEKEISLTAINADNKTENVAGNLSAELQKLPASSLSYPTSIDVKTAVDAVSIAAAGLSQVAFAVKDIPENKKTVVSLTDKSWIENYALYNRPAPKKWKGKLAWQAYFTPSVSYRKLNNSAAGKTIGNLAAGSIGSTNASLSKEVTQSASIGLEGGMGLQYPIFKGVKIKGGLQVNYTRYNISAFENSHPTITSLEMVSEFDGKPYELYQTTAYSNSGGLKPVTLHSQTFQISLPVGADIRLAGNDLFEWYAGAAIQPTVVFGGSSYLISTDRRNYVKDHSMLNHFNMNAAFETYISFKSPGGLTWQIGPQFRKQLYTTSSRLYTVEEKLMGYGLKVGFIKKF